MQKTLNKIFKAFLVLLTVMIVTAKYVYANEITAIDFNGKVIGKVIPDGSVVGLDNQIIGNVTADSFIVNTKGNIIGGVVPQGVVIGNDNKLLGKVNNDGTVRLPSGKIIGKTLPNALVVDDSYNILGSVLYPGLVYNDSGKTVGRLTGDGLYVSIDGQNIGFVSPSGYAYKNSGSGYTLDGRLISSKMVISPTGEFIGSIAPGGKVTDFDTKTIGSVHANGYVYDNTDKVIGRTVISGYAFDNVGNYLGLITYNGEVINQGNVVGRLRADNKIVNANNEVIGFFVDIAATANDFNGKYLGRIMPEGKVARSEDIIGYVGPRAMVYDNTGKIVGQLSYTGPVFDYLGNLTAMALSNGSAISMSGTLMGYTKGNYVYDNIGRILGAGADTSLIITTSNDVLGLKGTGADFSSANVSYKVSPFGYVFSSDSVLIGNTLELSDTYTQAGMPKGYVGIDGKINGVPTELGLKITQHGEVIDADNNIYSTQLSDIYYAIGLDSKIMPFLAQNNFITDGKGNITAKIVPEYDVVETTQSVSENMMPVSGNIGRAFMVIGFNGNMLGYAEHNGEVKNYAGNIIGKAISNNLVSGIDGSVIGQTADFNSVVNNVCEYIGVVSPKGDVRNGRDVVLGKILANNQVISDVGTMVGFAPKKGSLINFDGKLIANINGVSRAIDYQNRDLGCVKSNGRLYNDDNVFQASVVEPGPVMNFKNVIIGRILTTGKVINENSEIIGYVRPDGTVVSEDAEKILGVAFKYRFAFDNENNFMGRVNQKAEVVNDKNEVLAKVNYDGLVVSGRKELGYALYDVYVYDKDNFAIGYLTKAGSVTSFAGTTLGTADRGFLVNKNYEIIGRGSRDYFIRDKNNKVIGELLIDGDVVDNEYAVAGKVSGSGEVRDENGKLLAKARYLQYYNTRKPIIIKKPKNVEEEEQIQVGEIEIPEQITEEPQVKDKKMQVIGIAINPDGNFLGNILENNDVIDVNGNVIGKRTNDGLIIDNYGELAGVEEIKKTSAETMFVPAGVMGAGEAYGEGNKVSNLGPGGGYGPGERYDPIRAYGISAAHNLRREEFSVSKVSTKINKESYDGTATHWEGVSRDISSWRVDMSEMILADKPIPAVLARTIMSGADGVPVTAIVERNIYAEVGRNIVIPAGSRVMGSMGGFGGGSSGSSVRVSITWERLIRPDGSAFQFANAVTGDAQGKSGALGYIDEQLLKKYTLPLVTTSLTSAITYVAAAGETTTDSNGNSVQNAKAQAAEEARDNFVDGMNNIFQQILKDKTDISAVAYVPAGTRIIIYPKVDLWIRTPARELEDEKESDDPSGVLINGREGNVKGKGSDDKANSGGGSVHVMGAEDEKAQPSGGLIDEAPAKKKKPSRSAPIYNGAPPPPPSTGATASTYNQQSGALF